MLPSSAPRKAPASTHVFGNNGLKWTLVLETEIACFGLDVGLFSTSAYAEDVLCVLSAVCKSIKMQGRPLAQRNGRLPELYLRMSKFDQNKEENQEIKLEAKFTLKGNHTVL